MLGCCKVHLAWANTTWQQPWWVHGCANLIMPMFKVLAVNAAVAMP
jgi:hypothetical protein